MSNAKPMKTTMELATEKFTDAVTDAMPTWLVSSLMKELLGRFTLPEGIKLSYGGGRMTEDSYVVLVQGYFDDVNNPGMKILTGRCIDLEGVWLIPALSLHKYEEVAHRIFYGIMELWLHELYEFTKFDGKHLVDPHPNLLGAGS